MYCNTPVIHVTIHAMTNKTMKLSPKQKELLESVSYRDLINKTGIGQSTVKRLRSNISDMRIGTLEKILKKVWSISVQDFFNL